MPELIKRMNSGWVLMDSWITQERHTVYILERGKKGKCSFDIEPSGHGVMYKSNGEEVRV